MTRGRIIAVASLAVWGCAGSPASGPSATPSLCSRLHREIAEEAGDAASCGPDVTELLELTAVGNGYLLARRRFAAVDDLWQLTPNGLAFVSQQPQVDDEHLSALTLLPGAMPYVLVTDPRLGTWSLYNATPPAAPPFLATPQGGDWPAAGWKGLRVQPWGHEFIGLEDGNLLDRDLGDGSTRVWHLDFGPLGSPSLTLRADLAGGARDAFVRGHRLVYLAPGLLLEWAVPIGDNAPGVTATGCAGAAYAIWSYSLDAGSTARDPFAAVPRSSGCWDFGAGSDVLGDGSTLFVRDRASGEVRSYAVDPTLDDPLAAEPVDVRQAGSPDADRLKSPDWIPPTRSPNVKRLVLVLQDGRSFDSYFGRYCQAVPRSDGTPASCDTGPACCEAMPTSIAGAPGGCVALDAEPTYVPKVTPACMSDKIAGGEMSGFATAPCGDARDVACAGPDPDAGSVAAYRELAKQGALGDRMFQTFAYFSGAPPSNFTLGADVENLLYLGNTHFNSDLVSLDNTPFLTTELGRLEVEWAFYAGNGNLAAIVNASTTEPQFYDPSWYPYRRLQLGELDRDIALGQLPYVSVVLADAADADHGEGPGHSPANGIAFVKRLADTIAASPYRDDTLIVVTYLTAGGFFDHVSPPLAPGTFVDALDATGGQPIPYGPRVPMLAVGRFANANHISHTQLELSSLDVFIEWNWLHASPLKGSRQLGDVRNGRDTVANNIGSLLDSSATGEPRVPAGHQD